MELRAEGGRSRRITRELPKRTSWLRATCLADFVQVSSEQNVQSPWIIGAIVSAVRTGEVVFVPVSATALPGAELFLDEEWSAFEAVPTHLITPSPCIDDTAAAPCIPFFALLGRTF